MSIARLLRNSAAALSLCLAALPAAVQAQASASAFLEASLSGACSIGFTPATPSGTSTSVAAIVAAAQGGCTARGSSYAYLGVVGATAQAGYSGGNGNSGAFIRGASGASWTDGLDVTWPSRFQVAGSVDHVTLTYSVGATGSVSGQRSIDGDGNILGAGSSSIDYQFRFGNSVFNGSQSFNSFDGTSASSGSWGTISGSVTLNVIGQSNGRPVFDGISVSMAGQASAQVGNSFAGGTRQTTASADFGSTLIWQGVVTAHAYDAQGTEILLPGDFELELTGRQSGMNYWDAAVRQPVPEPGTAALWLVGLAGLIGLRRRVAR